MQSTSARTLFQSDASLAIGQARATKSKQTSKGEQWGSPIWLARAKAATAGGNEETTPDVDSEEGAAADGGRNKVLDMVVKGDDAWVAESGGTVRRINLVSGALVTLFNAHRAPCSALTLFGPSNDASQQILITASWDQSIRFFPATPSSSAISSPLCTIPNASSDFVKALHVVRLGNGATVLLSGGSDKLIRAWDLGPLLGALKAGESELPVPQSIGVSRDHTRPLTCFASIQDGPPGSDAHEPVFFSTDSMGRILQFHLDVRIADGKPSLRFEVQRELKGCQTGVYALRAAWREVEDDARREADRAASRKARGSDEAEDLEVEERRYYRAELWAASHDKTARRFDLVDASNVAITEGMPSAATSRGKTGPTTLGRHPALESSKVIEHDDYVKDVLPLSVGGPQLPADVVLTGSTDEEIRVWRVASSVEDAAAPRPDKAELERRAAGLRLSGKTAQAASDSTEGVSLVRVVQGHWHEVGRLELWWNAKGALGDEEVKKGAWFVVSASLDGSVRRWRLADILQPKPVESFVAEESGDKAPAAKDDKAETNPSGMTAEEEAELAELMGSDDE